MTHLNLPAALTRKLVDFAFDELLMIEADADEMHAPNGPVYWSPKDTRSLIHLLGDEKLKAYEPDNDSALSLNPRQAQILHTLVEVYAQEGSGWSDEDHDLVLAALNSLVGTI